MIKINRSAEPKFLKDNKLSLWTALDAAIKKYGSYKDIPLGEKSKLVSAYRHADVKSALVASSEGKCAFCECVPSEGGNVEVEHYNPKSLYPELTFEWENLLPSCNRCNRDKSDHDTRVRPIVNPYEHDPKEFFYYEGLNIKPLDGESFDVADLTIKVCGLNSLRLWEPRSKIYVSLHDFERSLQEALTKYNEAPTDLIKSNRLRSIREAVDRIEMLGRSNEKYSSFSASFLDASVIYLAAREILDSQ